MNSDREICARYTHRLASLLTITISLTPNSVPFQEISDFSDLQLKALLDEAMTYKNPKDLAHKSEVFKVSVGGGRN